MADALKKVQAGQRMEIPAEAYNAFIDAVRAERSRRHSIEQDAGLDVRQTGIIKVRNQSGSDQDRYHVLALRTPVVSPSDNLQEFKNQVSLDADAPSTPSRCERFAILLDPLPNGGMGRGIVSGVAPVRINVVRPTDNYAELVFGETGHLRSSPTGQTRILWKEAGTGIRWGVVRLSERPRFAIFELSGAWQPSLPPEPDGWMKMNGCRAVFYQSLSQTYAPDNQEPTETVWHTVGYPGPERAAVVNLHRSTGLVPAKHGCGDWVWCVWNEQECRWQAIAPYEDHWRFRLQTPLLRCGSAQAQLVMFQGGQWCPVPLVFTVHDSVGVVCPTHCQGPAGSGDCDCSSLDFAPAGTFGVAKHYADSCRWEVLALGDGCCQPPSSSDVGSSSSGSDSSSSSESSGSSSLSDPDSSAPSSSDPGSSSGSPSDPSGSGADSCVSVFETDVRCEDGKLNIYSRTVSICLSGGGLTRAAGNWVFSHQAGCCCCEGCDDSSSSSSSGSSSSSSYIEPPWPSSSGPEDSSYVEPSGSLSSSSPELSGSSSSSSLSGPTGPSAESSGSSSAPSASEAIDSSGSSSSSDANGGEGSGLPPSSGINPVFPT